MRHAAKAVCVEPPGTFRSIAFRKSRNSLARWRPQHLPMTAPVATSGAANSEVACLRLTSWVGPFGDTRQHRQDRLSADGSLFADREHRRAIQRQLAEVGDVSDLLHEVRG